ncbi:PREDICTED: protein lin-37 homolog isoform X1 [Amphimedon queenslandica]|uniref:Uncharacterized protein n=1 Tax=Amphimedon queenslandica TaxID=400682 RepID=A0AAN0IKN7_AMPQE|nr:PREDICTED: protein lin-37 homolog isoform X1 [Amphimedon queenslandica]|eukprot:XP_011403240.1 PREDICTED: protein lin-37 homolog isoform X1 [Amphimedon queenslandica]
MEVQSGRTQLRDVLEDLVLQRKDNKQDDHLDVDEDVEEAARDLLEYSSPRKRAYKQRRKRKRAQRDSLSDTAFSDDEKETSSSEVISIYGRHLNLSRLGKKPSLYSVCRDWVQNDPLGQVMGGTAKQLPAPISRTTENRDHFLNKKFKSYQVSKPVIDISVMDENLNTGLVNEEMPSLKTSYLQKWKQSCKRSKRDSKNLQQKHDKKT